MELQFKGASIRDILQDMQGNPHPNPHVELDISLLNTASNKRVGITMRASSQALRNEGFDYLDYFTTKFKLAIYKYCKVRNITFQCHDELIAFIQKAVDDCIKQYREGNVPFTTTKE